MPRGLTSLRARARRGRLEAPGAPEAAAAYGDGTLLGHVVGAARACAFDQIVVAIGGAAGEVRERST